MYRVIEGLLTYGGIKIGSYFLNRVIEWSSSPKPRITNSNFDSTPHHQLEIRNRYMQDVSESAWIYKMFNDVDLLFNFVQNCSSFHDPLGLLSTNSFFRTFLHHFKSLPFYISIPFLENASQELILSDFSKDHDIKFTVGVCSAFGDPFGYLGLIKFLKKPTNLNIDRIKFLHISDDQGVGLYTVPKPIITHVNDILELLQPNLRFFYCIHILTSLTLRNFANLYSFVCSEIRDKIILAHLPNLHIVKCDGILEKGGSTDKGCLDISEGNDNIQEITFTGLIEKSSSVIFPQSLKNLKCINFVEEKIKNAEVLKKLQELQATIASKNGG